MRSIGNAADLVLPDFDDRKKIHETLTYMKNQAWIRFEEEGSSKHDPIGSTQHIAINDLGIKLLKTLEENQKVWEKFAKDS